jgi:Flp pilus assembly protein TadB
MREWMPVWLFAVGIVVFLVLASLNSWLGDLLGLAWGFAILPLGALRLARGTRHDRRDDLQTHYWRSSAPR